MKGPSSSDRSLSRVGVDPYTTENVFSEIKMNFLILDLEQFIYAPKSPLPDSSLGFNSRIFIRVSFPSLRGLPEKREYGGVSESSPGSIGRCGWTTQAHSSTRTGYPTGDGPVPSPRGRGRGIGKGPRLVFRDEAPRCRVDLFLDV